MEEKKRKRINWELVVAIGLVLFFVCSCGRFNLLSGEYGGCASFTVFGKLELMGIDRVVISGSEGAVTLTDDELVGQLVRQTRVATHNASDCHQYCCGCDLPHWSIELYRGDKPVRTMDWQGCCDAVEVYHSDLTHWLIPALDATADAGYIQLSEDLADRLKELVGA